MALAPGRNDNAVFGKSTRERACEAFAAAGALDLLSLFQINLPRDRLIPAGVRSDIGYF
ncbi:hypothetical protein AGR6A_Cc150433 [Agrobacterium sp. NCPPB 925]|nr:hypothetical protein AGR6A_Cc150433 [Agrobacterium sp. NCPPB 925]